MSHLRSLRDLFVHELQDLHSAESQLLVALPKMQQAATDPDLKKAFEHHLGETRDQLERLDQCFSTLATTPGGKTCEAMQGLIKEGEGIIEADADPTVRDAALISAAQRVEHYEIAAYGTAKYFADILDYDDLQGLLDKTLKEESNADKKLNKIATGGMLSSGINKEAMEHGRRH
ncbi:MAG TPA: ferritin-like domain-containing protein [Thermoanaerobaculia bacterium]|nr:ferritin-like domain-containing protein [Thermoanaerobaculia bacterium]